MAENEAKNENVSVDFARSKLIWIIGAIILLVVGWFGFQAIISSSENYKLTLIDAPKESIAGTIVTFTWRIDGPATTIHHTAVYLGTESQPGELDKEVNPESTLYTLSVRDFESGDFNIPLQFIGNIGVDNPGIYYYRVQATINDKNYWTDEYSLEVLDNKISILDAPSNVIEDQVFTLTWRVDGVPTTINHTAIHYGAVSNPGELGKDVAPDDTEYTSVTEEFDEGEFEIPLQFIGNVEIASPGTYYYRGLAIINGQNYWTDEYVLEVRSETSLTPAEGEPTPEASPTSSESTDEVSTPAASPTVE